jgi:HD-GYP domain-containing protein (c-di-GMP phosphodiesterase class II)
VWDKAGPLSESERDQVRLHAYHSERILARVPALDGVARLAGRHHERNDGSGYHRGLTAAQLTMTARVLAAADVYHSLTEDRPHRPALTSHVASERLLAEARNGLLDVDAVKAVLASEGARQGIRRVRPADLTERQVEVLRLMATGASNRAIGRQLGISGRTAEHHVQDIYVKIGVSTRAAAALFAMEHGLLERSG